MTLAGSSGIRLLRSSPAMDQPAYCSLHSTYSVGARYEGIVFTGNSITCKALPSIKTVESCLLVSFAEEKDHLGGCKSQVSPGYQLRALMHTMDPSSSIAWSVSQISSIPFTLKHCNTGSRICFFPWNLPISWVETCQFREFLRFDRGKSDLGESAAETEVKLTTYMLKVVVKDQRILKSGCISIYPCLAMTGGMDWAFPVWGSSCTYGVDLCQFTCFLAQLSPPLLRS